MKSQFDVEQLVQQVKILQSRQEMTSYKATREIPLKQNFPLKQTNKNKSASFF